MSRKKTAAELAEDVRRLEQRLNKAKEKERRQSRAEEAKQNADVIRAVREYWDAMPVHERPAWKDMATYIRRLAHADVAQIPDPDEELEFEPADELIDWENVSWKRT